MIVVVPIDIMLRYFNSSVNDQPTYRSPIIDWLLQAVTASEPIDAARTDPGDGRDEPERGRRNGLGSGQRKLPAAPRNHDQERHGWVR